MILYDDIFGFDITVMKEVLQQYRTGDKAWKVFCEFYKDPDGYPINENGLRMKSGVECTVDGLLSVKRIYEHEGFNENFIDTFTIYREVPIIFFPKEQGGINQSRYSIFGDGIDHYCKRYHRSWSEHYYKNIKEKIKAFKEKIIVV